MAAVAITISGVLYDKYARTSRPVVLVGEASLTGLEIGGGPIIPDTPPVSPGIPTHPIMLPGMPGWGDPHPAHPIELPPGVPPGAGPVDPVFPMPPAANVPVHGTMYWIEGRGYVFVPDGAVPKPPVGQPGPGGDHIWGPTDPRPSVPIAGVPGVPGAPGDQPHPEHPIVKPEPPSGKK